MTTHSYAPYSGYRVGVAGLVDDVEARAAQQGLPGVDADAHALRGDRWHVEEAPLLDVQQARHRAWLREGLHRQRRREGRGV